MKHVIVLEFIREIYIPIDFRVGGFKCFEFIDTITGDEYFIAAEASDRNIQHMPGCFVELLQKGEFRRISGAGVDVYTEIHHLTKDEKCQYIDDNPELFV